MIQTCIFFDIETLPTERPDVVAYIDAGITHPGTMSKPETIAAWEAEKRPEVLRESVSKTALEGGLGRVASIAFAVGDCEVVSATSAKPGSEEAPAAYDADQERKLLTRFFAACDRVRKEMRVEPTLVGHNIAGFDIRWLWKRSIVLSVQPPDWWPVDAKPWERDRIFDTMIAWEGHGGRISQDRLCLALGLPMKTDFDGSMVEEAWNAGEFEKIRAYNADDVRTVRSIWKRLTLYREPVSDTPETPISATSATSATPRSSVGFRPVVRASSTSGAAA